MIHQQVIGFEQHKRACEKMRELGEKTGKIDAIYRAGAKPFIQAMKNIVPVRSTGVQLSRYRSRMHPAGTLKRSIRFVKSKRVRKGFYIGAISKPGADTYYRAIFISESKGGVIGSKEGGKSALINGRWIRTQKKIGGYKGTPFVDMAFQQTEQQSMSIIEKQLYELTLKYWKAN